LHPKIAALQNQQTITQAQYSAINSERDAALNNYIINVVPKGAALIELYGTLPTAEQVNNQRYRIVSRRNYHKGSSHTGIVGPAERTIVCIESQD
jgi:hypothetical protein